MYRFSCSTPLFLSPPPPQLSEQPPVRAFVDLTAGNFARGRNLEPVRLQLPKDFQLAQPATPLVAFYLDEIANPER